MRGKKDISFVCKIAGRWLVLFTILSACSTLAADHQAWLKQSIDAPLFTFWEGGRLSFGAEQEEKFGRRGFIDSETLAMIELEACPYFAISLGDRFVYERSRGRGDLVPEHRPTLDVVLSTGLKLPTSSEFRVCALLPSPVCGLAFPDGDDIMLLFGIPADVSLEFFAFGDERPLHGEHFRGERDECECDEMMFHFDDPFVAHSNRMRL